MSADLDACRSELAQAVTARRSELQHSLAEHMDAMADLIEGSGLTAEELDMGRDPAELRSEAVDLRNCLL